MWSYILILSVGSLCISYPGEIKLFLGLKLKEKIPVDFNEETLDSVVKLPKLLFCGPVPSMLTIHIPRSTSDQ